MIHTVILNDAYLRLTSKEWLWKRMYDWVLLCTIIHDACKFMLDYEWSMQSHTHSCMTGKEWSYISIYDWIRIYFSNISLVYNYTVVSYINRYHSIFNQFLMYLINIHRNKRNFKSLQRKNYDANTIVTDWVGRAFNTRVLAILT